LGKLWRYQGHKAKSRKGSEGERAREAEAIPDWSSQDQVGDLGVYFPGMRTKKMKGVVKIVYGFKVGFQLTRGDRESLKRLRTPLPLRGGKKMVWWDRKIKGGSRSKKIKANVGKEPFRRRKSSARGKRKKNRLEGRRGRARQSMRHLWTGAVRETSQDKRQAKDKSAHNNCREEPKREKVPLGPRSQHWRFLSPGGTQEIKSPRGP